MPLTFSPFAAIPAVDELGHELRMNVSDSERIASGIFAAALISAGLSRVGPARWLFLFAGGALAYRGWTGRCPGYDSAGLDRRHGASGVPGDRGTKIEHSIEIHRSPDVLYAFWRDLEKLPTAMRHVQSVRCLSSRRSQWQIRGPFGRTVEWDAEIISEEPGRHIAWQTLPGSTIANAGSVWFEPTDAGGTRLRVTLQFDPPAGAVGAGLAALLGSSPQRDLMANLEQFKAFAEKELIPFAAPSA